MNVGIHFPAEIRKSLRRRAAAAGQDLEAFVQEVVRERLEQDNPPQATASSHDEFMSRLRTI